MERGKGFSRLLFATPPFAEQGAGGGVENDPANSQEI
jgi:hypothetical protein